MRQSSLGGDSPRSSAKWNRPCSVHAAVVPPRILMWGWARWGDRGSPGLSHRDTTLSMLPVGVQWQGLPRHLVQGGLVLLQLPGGQSHPNLYEAVSCEISRVKRRVRRRGADPQAPYRWQEGPAIALHSAPPPRLGTLEPEGSSGPSPPTGEVVAEGDRGQWAETT